MVLLQQWMLLQWMERLWPLDSSRSHSCRSIPTLFDILVRLCSFLAVAAVSDHFPGASLFATVEGAAWLLPVVYGHRTLKAILKAQTKDTKVLPIKAIIKVKATLQYTTLPSSLKTTTAHHHLILNKSLVPLHVSQTRLMVVEREVRSFGDEQLG